MIQLIVDNWFVFLIVAALVFVGLKKAEVHGILINLGVQVVAGLLIALILRFFGLN